MSQELRQSLRGSTRQDLLLRTTSAQSKTAKGRRTRRTSWGAIAFKIVDQRTTVLANVAEVDRLAAFREEEKTIEALKKHRLREIREVSRCRRMEEDPHSAGEWCRGCSGRFWRAVRELSERTWSEANAHLFHKIADCPGRLRVEAGCRLVPVGPSARVEASGTRHTGKAAAPASRRARRLS